jgi:hypothetical protein
MDESNLDELIYQLNNNQLNNCFLSDIKCILVLNESKNQIGTYSLFNDKFQSFFKLFQEYLLKTNAQNLKPSDEQKTPIKSIFKQEPVDTAITKSDSPEKVKIKLKSCFVRIVKLTNTDILQLKNDLKQKKCSYKKNKTGFIFKPKINNIAKKKTGCVKKPKR